MSRKMINNKKTLLFITIIAISISAFSQEESADVKDGNKLYKSEKYVDAEVSYRKGLQKNPKSFEANYNLGNALFKQGKYPEALEQYQRTLALKSADKNKMAAAFHNTGNALLSDKKIQESINAYKMSLKLNPNDDETRYNLAYAQKLLKKQQQDKNKDKDKDKKEQEKEQNKEQQQQQQQQQSSMTKQNAQQILDALMQDEKNTMENKKRQNPRNQKSAEKNW